MRNHLRISLFVLLACVAIAAPVVAAATPQEIARLGQDLTPLGGEKAGNAAGTIPAWDGGLAAPPAGWQPGKHYVDPFAAEQPRLVIDAKNMAQHAEQLSAGHQAMLKAYPTFKLNVYPTHRTAAAPQRIYDLTRKTAASAVLDPSGNGVTGAVGGIPFPFPKTGNEVIWNHLTRYRAEIASRKVAQAAPTRGGDYTLVQFDEETMFLYHLPGMTEQKLANRLLLFKQAVTAPARLAGGILLVHETMNQIQQPRDAWLYNPGQRRVRRAPQVAYDNPGTAADNMRTSDQLDMFNGAPDRYDWKLVGKREIFVPYNAYKLQRPETKYKDILKPLHMNPDHLRYELHRVWVVDATLKPGERHIYKRRTFYFDEDSWQILLIDQYDNRDQLWRVSEGHAMTFYDVPSLWTAAESHTDLQAGRYLVMGLFGESTPHDFKIQRTEADFTPDSLRREGVR
jgi:hypothetical protein